MNSERCCVCEAHIGMAKGHICDANKNNERMKSGCRAKVESQMNVKCEESKEQRRNKKQSKLEHHLQQKATHSSFQIKNMEESTKNKSFFLPCHFSSAAIHIHTAYEVLRRKTKNQNNKKRFCFPRRVQRDRETYLKYFYL